MAHATTWMNIDDIMPGEVRSKPDRKRHTLYDSTLMRCLE